MLKSKEYRSSNHGSSNKREDSVVRMWIIWAWESKTKYRSSEYWNCNVTPISKSLSMNPQRPSRRWCQLFWYYIFSLQGKGSHDGNKEKSRKWSRAIAVLDVDSHTLGVNSCNISASFTIIMASHVSSPFLKFHVFPLAQTVPIPKFKDTKKCVML